MGKVVKRVRIELHYIRHHKIRLIQGIPQIVIEKNGGPTLINFK